MRNEKGKEKQACDGLPASKDKVQHKHRRYTGEPSDAARRRAKGRREEEEKRREMKIEIADYLGPGG